MAGMFEPVPGGGAAVALDEVEVSILRSLAVQLLELIGPGPGGEKDPDPLAELFAEGPSEPPSDPVLQRLFPDAYGDPEAVPDDQLKAYSAEFRRFTENDLRAGKRENALAVVRTLDALTLDGEGGAVLKLTPDDSKQWLGALNDLRLAIASRLDVISEEDTELLYRLPDSDPRKPMVMAYLWLGGLQETLVETLMA
ncbi:DUF2017 domain-containing protein [Streptomyces sp. TRM66268-LWL]|uniref:DUF2017 domain-containing protein n=1 Tax=Streptomyces polyasparticus TaxID=2767826 RepID=A0ABR7SRW8_9ACTN|nr:DUF2017 domain-containing protein [Streptomyces polyasparticus]MBC9718252.1 DUF2017 domain-containing protein [Streptomyces polyasparticus]